MPTLAPMMEYAEMLIFLGRDGKLYRATFDTGPYFHGWDVAEIRLEWWAGVYPPW